MRLRCRPEGRWFTARWYLVVILSGIVSQTGCLGPFELVPGSMMETGNSEKPELPPREKARVNLKAAENMFNEGKHLASLQLFARARQSQPSLKIAYKMALLHDRLGHGEQAQREYEKALKEKPNSPSVVNSYGRFYYDRRKWKEAEQRFRNALELLEKSENSWWQHIALFSKRRTPEQTKRLRAVIWNNLGLTLAQQNKYQDSLVAFKKVVPPAAAHSNLAFVLSTQGHHWQAIREYRKALRYDPELQLARMALKKLEATMTQKGQPEAKLPTGGPGGVEPLPANPRQSPRHLPRSVQDAALPSGTTEPGLPREGLAVPPPRRQ